MNNVKAFLEIWNQVVARVLCDIFVAFSASDPRNTAESGHNGERGRIDQVGLIILENTDR